MQNTKNKTAVKLTAVSCAPVVEVKIKRPDTKYQLGFSVQNGVVSPGPQFQNTCQVMMRHKFAHTNLTECQFQEGVMYL